jgi:outer membrane protein
MRNKRTLFSIFALLSASVALQAQATKPAAEAPSKIGIINIQGAIGGTKDGQKAAQDLDGKYAPKQKDFQQRQAEIQQLRDQLQKGSNTLSAEKRAQLERDIDEKTRRLTRDQQDTQEEFNNDRQKLLQAIGPRMMAVISKYAKDNGYSMVLDTSQDLVYASSGLDITQDIVTAFDKTPATAAPPAGTSPARPGGTAAPASPGAPAVTPRR